MFVGLHTQQSKVHASRSEAPTLPKRRPLWVKSRNHPQLFDRLGGARLSSYDLLSSRERTSRPNQLPVEEADMAKRELIGKAYSLPDLVGVRYKTRWERTSSSGHRY